MRCPACRKRLKLINPTQSGEYICGNEKCPEKTDEYISPEFYGRTQEEVDNNQLLN